MTAISLTQNPLYKRLPLGGRNVLFHCSVAYTTKREAETTAKEIRRVFDQPARVIKGANGLYYVYVHGES